MWLFSEAFTAKRQLEFTRVVPVWSQRRAGLANPLRSTSGGFLCRKRAGLAAILSLSTRLVNNGGGTTREARPEAFFRVRESRSARGRQTWWNRLWRGAQAEARQGRAATRGARRRVAKRRCRL